MRKSYPDAAASNREIVDWSNHAAGNHILYRGWVIDAAYIGWSATHPDFDASWEGEEDGWVGNGLQVHAMTIETVKLEVDYYLEEHPEWLL